MLKNASLDEILNSSKEANIEKIMTIAVEPENLDVVKDISEKYPQVFFSQGIHPHDAIKYNDEVEKIIRSRCSHPKMLAVGEIGLDFYYNNSPKEVQIEVFERQLQIAIDNDKPIIIHSRDAEDETIAVLEKYQDKLKRKGVVHSFTSRPHLAEYALKIGFYLGFNGIITFKNAQNVRDVVELAPLSHILLETDAPFLTPVPHRGKENAPFYLPHIAEKIAEIKGVAVAEVLSTCYQNSLNLFRF